MMRLAFAFAFGLLLMLAKSPLKAQEVSGQVVGTNDGKGVSFAHIIDSSGRLLAVCDLEGRFSLKKPPLTLIFSSVGYERKIIRLDNPVLPLVIGLENRTEHLAEVVVKAGENPALRIIRNARAHLERNAPQALPFYSLRRYNRLVIGADSANPLPDQALSKHLRKHELLIMESVVDEHFTKASGKISNVVANRISGFKDPVFVFLMEQLHSTDFFGEFISIGGVDYVSPLAKGSISRYNFVLEEVLAVGEHDSLFTIRFEPLSESRFIGLSGKISIQSPDWAIRSVVAKPAFAEGSISAEIKQLYEKSASNAWFPVLINTQLWLSLPFAGGNIRLAGEGFSRITQVSFDTQSTKNKSGRFDLKIDAQAWHLSDGGWQQLRPDSLSRRLSETYHFMDSLGKERNLDRLLTIAGTLSLGKIPLGRFDLPIADLLKFNNIEGYKPGFGFLTNKSFSRNFTVNGYGGYASRLRKFLWIAGMQYHYLKWPGSSFSVTCFDKHQARESGLEPENDGLFNATNLRQFFYNSIRHEKGFRLEASLPVDRKLSLHPYYTRKNIKEVRPTTPQFEVNDNFLVNSAGLMLRLAFGERTMWTGTTSQRLERPNPLVMADLRLVGASTTDHYTVMAYQLLLALDYAIRYPFAGTTLLRLESGLSSCKLPEILLYQLPASYNKYLLFAPNSFGTLIPGGSGSSNFVALYLSHSFLPLRSANRKFRPQPVALHHIAVQTKLWENHNSRPFRLSLVSESGLFLNRLLNAGNANIGAGLLYRWHQPDDIPRVERFIFKIALSLGDITL